MQIGPRIRVGGTLGKVGKVATLGLSGGGLTKVGHAIGDAQNNPLVKGLEAAALTATGVGIPAAAGILGGAGLVGGAIRSGGGIKGALTQGAQGALTGGAAGLVRPAFGAVKSGLMSVGSKLLPGGMPSTGQSEDDFYNEANGIVTGGSSNPLVSVGKSALSGMAPKNKDGSIDYGALLKLGIGAGTAYEGYKSNQQATDDRKKALDLASAQYNANAPLRAQATQGLQQTQRPDLSPLFADGNPYKPKPTPIVPPIAPSGLMTVGRRPMPTTGRRMF